MIEDSELLRRYAENRSEAAFAELVKRRVSLVYSVALRQVGQDTHLAEDVTQKVFADLARKASALASRPVLSGWLCRSAQFAASDVVRAERRRRAREEANHLMHESPIGPASDAADWDKLRPVIDEAMAELGDEDRDAVALTAKNIELLAGSGDLPNARTLAERLLAYDHSEATRALIQKHIERAGQPGLLTEVKRAEAVESDNAALASALQTAQVARAKAAAAPVTREVFEERLRQALALAQGGEADAALRELRWCYDAGMARPGGLTGPQMSLVVGALTKLGERYPAALGELRERMENARRRVLGHADDMEPLREIAAIARALKDEQAMVALYDAIPVGDVRRQRAAIYAVDGLVAAQRYGDALVGRPYGTMVSNFESNLPFLSAPTPAATREGNGASRRNYAISSAAKSIEVLAGAGNLVHARELAGRLLALDNSEATQALLLQHLKRAGQPELLKKTER